MSVNPLQQFFRQPKIFVKLPSMGVYNEPGSIIGDPSNLPVFGMTGMDEIVMKTPDALFSGESVVRVLKSCCPGITDPWAITTLDIDLLLTAIKIASFGNKLSVTHVCEHCTHTNDYDIDLNSFIEHFSSCEYDSKIVLKDLAVKLRPLTYKQITDFNIKNYAMQKQMSQASTLENEEEKQVLMTDLFKNLGDLQIQILTDGIESVETGSARVDQKVWLREWIENCDRTVIEDLRKHIEVNNEKWRVPPSTAVCENCGSENKFNVEIDQSNFFVGA
jgi:hypothetical protein